MAGIYLHIPFCKKACYYCDFHFSTYQVLQKHIIKSIISELMLRKDYLGENIIETIYFGGGTPSILEVSDLRLILKIIYDNYNISKDPEITLEANPDDLCLDKAIELRQSGFNRLSIGIQSFHEEILQYLNRSHSATQAYEAIENVTKAGFNNFSTDLIFAISDNHLSITKDDINTLLRYKVPHISTYSLTIEPNTVFGNWLHKDKIGEVPADNSAEEFEFIIEKLSGKGYEHYEVSNFALPGFLSQHNSNYWRQIPYLGVGPSAHSYNGISRQFNINNNSLYIRSIEKGEIPLKTDYLTDTDRINEEIMVGLRTKWGCDFNRLKKMYKIDLFKIHKKYVEKLIEHDLATFFNGKLQLSKNGMLIADKISADFFIINKKH